MAQPPPSQPPTAHAPDPEEDDLDDLDDVLDEFQPTTKPAPPAATSSQPSPPAPKASGPGRPPAVEDASEFPDAGEEALAAQLQAGMANLMSELDENPDMQAQFEAMMKELIAAGEAPSEAEAARHVEQAAKAVPKIEGDDDEPKGRGSGKKGEEHFSETVKRTMARMQASDSTASASASAPEAQSSEEDLLAQMMKELQAGGTGLGGEGGEEDFNKMLMNMMTQLTNKEILYEPMKELHDKFPGWMEKHRDSKEVKREDMERYIEQQRLVGEIVQRFERKGYSDDNEGDRDYIVERMQKVRLTLANAFSHRSVAGVVADVDDADAISRLAAA